MKWVSLALAAFCVALASTATSALAQQAAKPPSAESVFKHQMNDPAWKKDYTGEDFGWHAGFGMGDFLRYYHETGDTSYLDEGVKYYDALIARLDVGPDGYKGWIGPFEYSPKYWCDAHVGDAVLFGGILDFAATVLRDPKLKEKYGDKATSYIAEAKKDLFEKWDARGTFHDEGPIGYYVTLGQVRPAARLQGLEAAARRPSVRGSVRLGASRSTRTSTWGCCAIRIWQATGDEKYKHRAEQLFGFMKSRMQEYNGAYHWNYWEPAYIGDLGLTPKISRKANGIPPRAEKTMRGWINVHRQRNYQAGEVANIVDRLQRRHRLHRGRHQGHHPHQSQGDVERRRKQAAVRQLQRRSLRHDRQARGLSRLRNARKRRRIVDPAGPVRSDDPQARRQRLDGSTRRRVSIAATSKARSKSPRSMRSSRWATSAPSRWPA